MRLKVLLSAYACGPGKGSDPGIGWNIAKELAKTHDVWVITRHDNAPEIMEEMEQRPIPHLNVIYYDIPYIFRWWREGLRGVQFHYYLWQIGIYFLAKTLHQQINFDIAHHVTYVKHWGPSFISLLPIPFVWGPVGGGESAPKSFWHDFTFRGKRYEFLRDSIRWIAEKDPFVKMTATRSAVALAATKETAQRLSVLGCPNIQIEGVAGLPQSEQELLGCLPPPPPAPFRLISIGRLLHWKGFYLGLKAFARLDMPEAEYWIIGDGPDRKLLEKLAETLGVSSQVHFLGKLPREETLNKLAACHGLVHPSLHDSGGWVCLEAMAAARPVLCLDLGGPATQVTEDSGFKVAAPDPEQAVENLAMAMGQLAENLELCSKMGEAGQARVKHVYDWSVKTQIIADLYQRVLSQAQPAL